MIDVDDYLYFADKALEGMSAIVSELDDDAANRQAYAGANTPYSLLHHCLAVVETWAGGFIHGRPIVRDRDAEFEASGPVADLISRVPTTRDQLRQDARAARPAAPLVREPPTSFQGPARRLTQGAALQHVFEELAQHHGQMEILRDVIVLRQPNDVSA